MKEKRFIPIAVSEEPESSACGEAEAFALMVLGDSMEPEFVEGEIIIIEPEGLATDGSYVLAQAERRVDLSPVGESGRRLATAPLEPGLSGHRYPRPRLRQGRHHPEEQAGPPQGEPSATSNNQIKRRQHALLPLSRYPARPGQATGKDHPVRRLQGRLRRGQAPAQGARSAAGALVKVIFAENELQAEDLLTQVREAEPITGDDW